MAQQKTFGSVGSARHYGVAAPTDASIFGAVIPTIDIMVNVKVGAVTVGEVMTTKLNAGFYVLTPEGDAVFEDWQPGVQTGTLGNGLRGVAMEAGAVNDIVRVRIQGVVTVEVASSTVASSPLTHSTGTGMALAANGESVWGYSCTAESGGFCTAVIFPLPIGTFGIAALEN